MGKSKPARAASQLQEGNNRQQQQLDEQEQLRAEAEIRAAWQHGATATSYAPKERLQSFGALQRKIKHLEARTKKQHFMTCLAIALCRHELPRLPRNRSKEKKEVATHPYCEPMVSSVRVLVAAGLQSFHLTLCSRRLRTVTS
jgi:hypothetical protein